MVENFTNPFYMTAIVWLMIGLMIMGPLPKSKLPFVVEMLLVLFLAAGWPFLLIMANRR